jgi:hypothetical protein
VTFAPVDDQSSQEMCVPLPISDDLIANEANEQFSVVLIDVTPLPVDVGNNVTCVTIIDNDGKYTLFTTISKYYESSIVWDDCVIHVIQIYVIGTLNSHII